MNNIQACKGWLRAHQDLAMDLVRIYLGIGLIAKAVFLMQHREFFSQMLADAGQGWFTPAFIGQYVVLAHLFGGLMLVLGIATRLAAFVNLPILLGAVFWVHLPRYANVEPRQYLEYAALVAFLLLLLGVFGAGGRFSIDYVMSRKWRETRAGHGPVLSTKAH
jgi:putative oxidoreductase